MVEHFTPKVSARSLIAGWFSFPGCEPTAGDIETRDLIGRWHELACAPYDYLVSPPLVGGVTLAQLDPTLYSRLIVVCGPYSINEPYQTALLSRMQHCRKVGINLSMIQPVGHDRNGFDILFERDSDQTTRPDLSLLFEAKRTPVVGRILVGPQSEYGQRGMHQCANEKIAALLDAHDLSPIEIDTRLPGNARGLSSVDAIESVIAKMDVIVTTRLHGLVLALKHGVPVLAVDPILGGAKITAQARELDWPVVYTADDDIKRLIHGLDFCLRPEAKSIARDCGVRGKTKCVALQAELLRTMFPAGCS